MNEVQITRRTLTFQNGIVDITYHSEETKPWVLLEMVLASVLTDEIEELLTEGPYRIAEIAERLDQSLDQVRNLIKKMDDVIIREDMVCLGSQILS